MHEMAVNIEGRNNKKRTSFDSCQNKSSYYSYIFAHIRVKLVLTAVLADIIQ